MPGSDHILSKGFLATGSAAITAGTVAELVAGSTLQPAQVGLATAATDDIIGVFQEDLDADKVTTGKAYVGVQIMGIARCVASAAVALGARVTATTDGKLVTTTTAGQRVVGIAVTTAAADGDWFQVLLTPGGLVPA